MDHEFKTEILNILNQSGSETTSDQFKDFDFSLVTNIMDAVKDKNSEKLILALNAIPKTIMEDKQDLQKLGHLARQFQNSLISFRDGMGARIESSVEGDEYGHAQTQIESVMKMTNDAAMKVLELTDKQHSSFQELQNELGVINSLLNSGTDFETLKETMQIVSKRVSSIKATFEDNNNHLLISQSYQDLTGQVLLRIKSFVSSVEHGLLELVRMLGSHSIDHHLVEIDNIKLANQCNQDDVDNLLASLGF